MALEKIKGYFYDPAGILTMWYEGFGDLSDLDDLLKHKGESVGFITSNGVDTAAHYYNFETEQIEEI